MKNPPPAKKREEAAGSMDDEDRISQLPQPILHHILSFLPQEEAVRTCLLSKPWRHLGLTRPKFEFLESSFPGNKQNFLSVAENAFQRYVDQKLSVHEFIFGMQQGSPSMQLKKWIPILIRNMGVKKLNLKAHYYSLPSDVFQAESLEELDLVSSNLTRIDCIVKLQMLKRLNLCGVFINDETFEKIILGCPLIEHLVLKSCQGFSSTIKVNNARNLKHFDCKNHLVNIEFNDDTPSLETISIRKCRNWHHRNFFPHLKSLHLWYVHLPTESFSDLSSNNCPCLEELDLFNCPGFREFKLSNRSIKRLSIRISDRRIKAVIDAPNMLYFEFGCCYIPSISFTATSNELKSCIQVWGSSNVPLKLYEFLKSLSQSQISLDISGLESNNRHTYDVGSPVVVEHLCLSEYDPSLLNCMFRICRPRYIGLPTYVNLQITRDKQLVESVWKTLVNKGEMRQCDFWKQDLKEASIQVSDKDTNIWRPGQECPSSDNQSIRFRLKWRDLS